MNVFKFRFLNRPTKFSLNGSPFYKFYIDSMLCDLNNNNQAKNGQKIESFIDYLFLI